MDSAHFYSQVAPILMVALIVIFAGIAAWAYWPKLKERFEKDAQIPLRDDD